MKEDVKYFYKKVHLIVEVAVGVRGSLGDLASDDDLRKTLEEGLNDWSDGRQNFSTEIFKDGLERSVEGSLRKAVYDDACRRFPNKVTLEGTSFACKFSDHKLTRLESVRAVHDVEVIGVKTFDNFPK